MNIVIITYDRYPEGDAGSVREHAIAKLMKELEHNVFIIGMGTDDYKKENQFDNVSYISIRREFKNKLEKVKNYLLYKNRLKKALNEYNENHIINAILVVDVPFNAFFMIKSFAMKNKVKLIHDSVEWYSPSQFKFGVFSISFLKKELCNRFLINKKFNVIAISDYLYKHFSNKNINVIKIPVILDVKNMIYTTKTSNDKLTFLYAGSPGKKDYLEQIIEGILSLSDETLSQIEFKIIGITIEQLNKQLKVDSVALEKLNKCITFMGRIPRIKVIENIMQADYTILLRSEKYRYAKAGFPTKVVESLSCGTPVILNITSDLRNYIKDMQQGIIVKDCTANSFAQAIEKALTISNEQRELMRQESRKCAEQFFDYRNYKELLGNLLDRNLSEKS
jgi:glycosyltransferase involved in cell wall biosynthesis